MDPASTRLAMKLQLDDIDEILQELAGSIHDTSSEVAAFKAHRDELQRRWDEVNGQCIAMLILREENNNRLAFIRLLEEERQAQTDHVIACDLAGVQLPGGPDSLEKRCAEATGSDLKNYTLNGPPIDVDKIVFNFNPPAVTYDLPGPVHSGKGKGKAGPGTFTQCVSCLEILPKTDVLQLDCKRPDDEQYHAYCEDCMDGLFNSCITDPSMFPPSCCAKPLNVTACIPFLTGDMLDRFYEKEEELGTTDPTYCSNAECTKWVPLAKIKADVATCIFCSQKTCATCKGKQHQGLCPEDEGTQQLMLTAKKKEWQTCPKCKNMVELESGCYHIYCRCRYEFCYLCLKKWKTCECKTWDERNLILRPEPAAAAPPPPLLQPVQRIGVNIYDLLMENRIDDRAFHANNVDHQHVWRHVYRSQGHDTNCTVCSNTGFRRSDRCDGCQITACWYCLKNNV